MSLYGLARPFLFSLDAENAHQLALRTAGVAALFSPPPARAPVRAMGIEFPNPIGLGAGLDKDAEHIDAMGALGFGFLEVGTVTPRAQPGNPKPRMFRLPEHEAIINRMGFNNDGVDALVRNVERSTWRGVLGINIGKNAITPNQDALQDYLCCLERVYPLASYVTVNISSPNTQGLRELQDPDELPRLLGALRERQEQLAVRHSVRKPMLLKIAPDLDEAQMDAIARTVLDAQVDGLICTNTTIDRAAVAGEPLANEAGGLSGRPLFERSTAILRGMAQRLAGKVPLIGVGGVLTGSDAAEKFDAGAALVQIYTGLVYRGPWLLTECVEEIRRQRGSDDGP